MSGLSLPFLPVLPTSHAALPVWSDSTTKPVRFAPLAKKAAVRLWHRARDFDRGTISPDTMVAPSVLPRCRCSHALIFDFLNHRSGRLDPSYAAIAAKAGVCVRTVATALKRLRELGILNWIRRCAESWADGRFVLEQETNAYAVLPESQWRGYRPPPEPPAAPWPDTWGEPTPMPSALAQAALEGDLAGKVQALAATPRMAWLPPWRGSGRRSWHETPDFPGVHEMRRNTPQS